MRDAENEISRYAKTRQGRFILLHIRLGRCDNAVRNLPYFFRGDPAPQQFHTPRFAQRDDSIRPLGRIDNRPSQDTQPEAFDQGHLGGEGIGGKGCEIRNPNNTAHPRRQGRRQIV